MSPWHRHRSGSGTSFRETFRNRKRSGSTEFLFSEIQNAFDPSSSFITTWQQLILGCILYELLLIPYMATFHSYDLTSSVQHDLLGMYVCELVFCVDIYVQLNTGYYEDGNVLRDTRKSRIKYLKSVGFVLDVLALPPLSLLPVSMHLSVVFLEFHKLSRLRRLPQLISNLDNIYARYFEPLKLAKVLGITIVVSHLVACGRFTFGYDSHHHDHWLPQVHEHEQSGRSKYLMSLFWAFGLLTGLFEGELPHTNAEFAFTIFVALCGFSLFTYLCATFFMLSKCESGDSETSEARVNQFKHILAFHRVPEKLQEQAVEYLKRYYTQAEANDREAARLLCPSISTDIQIELLRDTVAQIPVFEGCDSHFINAVTSLLELISCPAHFVLFQTGDHGDAMYVVSSGVLYTVINGVKVRELRKGSFFGEVAVFAKLPRSATMMTTTYSTLYRLSRFHAEKLLEGYPRYAQLISQTVSKMLQEAQTNEEDKISEIASAGAIQVQKKKKKSSLLQVIGLKTEQPVWRSKKSLTQYRVSNILEI
uniref:Cyclic nucleotide-binding domain-containing protein n=1 Tax=Globisporangium ultimum (strain ATCC 200006 / CBS 805.95 / DAOM BR144) TaxID=431595 RepID=K3WAT0_GLOUD